MPEMKWRSPPGENLPIYAAFGEFISIFAFTEAVFHGFLRNLTGMKPESARVIVAGMRNSDLIKKIRDLVEFSEFDDKAKTRLERIFKQFLIINEMRDYLVHRWTKVHEGMIIATDYLTSKKEVSPVLFHHYDLEMFYAAMLDLHMMSRELDVLIHPRWHQNPANHKTFLDYTWQYTPVQPATMDHKSLPNLLSTLPRL